MESLQHNIININIKSLKDSVWSNDLPKQQELIPKLENSIKTQESKARTIESIVLDRTIEVQTFRKCAEEIKHYIINQIDIILEKKR